MPADQAPFTGRISFIRDLGASIETFVDADGTQIVAVTSPRTRRPSGGRYRRAEARSRSLPGAGIVRPEPLRRIADYSPLAFPAVMLTVFFVAVRHHGDGQLLPPPAGRLHAGLRAGELRPLPVAFFGGVLSFSLGLAACVALICVVGFPFTYELARAKRWVQVSWLVALLSVLSLSEVIIGFAWSTLLSRTAGISNLVWLGMMDKPVALTPNFGAVLTGMVYQAFPYTVLVLYPAMARLDPTLMEAAGRWGASAEGVPDRRRAGFAQHHRRHLHHGVRLRAWVVPAAAVAWPAAALDAVGADHGSGRLPVEHAVRRGHGRVPGAGDAVAGGIGASGWTEGCGDMSGNFSAVFCSGWWPCSRRRR